MAQSRLSKILEQEYKTKGFVGGTTSAVGKRALEKLDIRNALFGGSGLGSIIGRKIFGKGYSATRGASSTSGISSASAEMTSLSNSILEEVNINSKITAKNTMALPTMARDMNVMRQNVIKLVKLQGGTPTNRADAWFMKAKEREAAYESQFGASRKPTPVTEKSSRNEGAGGLLGFLGSMASKLGSAITGIASALGPVITTALATLGNVLTAAITALGVALGAKALAGRGGVVGVPGKGGKAPKGGGRFGKLGLALSAALAAILGYDYLTDDEEGGAADTTGATGESGASSGIDWMNLGKNAAIVGAGTVGAAGTVAAISSRSAVQGYNTAAKRFTDASGKFTSAKNLPKGDMLKKFIDFAVKAQSKGWMGKIFGKLAVRLGTGIAMKAMTFLGGLAVPGAGWAVSAISLALLAADAYFIYDAIFGEGGILEELEKEDNRTTSPTPVPGTDSAATPPVPSSPSPSAEGAAATFNSLSKAQQDSLLMAQAKAEGSTKPGTVGYRHNNPGNIIAKSPTEVYPAQAKFGGVPGETIKGPDGVTRTFVRFPTWEDGLNAQRDLWARKYGNKPIDQALAQWAPDAGRGSGYEKTIMAGINGSSPAMAGNPSKGTTLNGQSTAVASSGAQPPVVVVQNNNNTQTAPQSPPIQVTTADVLDSEMGKLLLARVYGMA